MRKATLFVSFMKNNRVFDIDDPIANRDDGRRFHYDLKRLFAEKGFDLSTQEINPPENSEFVLYHDFPRIELDVRDAAKSFLMIMEPPVVKPKAWDRATHKFFDRVFTYHDPFLGEEKYVKINYVQKFPERPNFELGTRPKFCTTVIGQKSSDQPNELYSLRLNLVKWFEEHHPDEFEFYGTRWKDFTYREPGGLLSRFFGKKHRLQSYRGEITNKNEVLQQYKFTISFENCKNVDGYISEKIFDCFLAGSVPIYYGAPNIADHIPPECFIDFGKLSSFEEMYDVMANMPDDEYVGYQRNILRFLTSSENAEFRSEPIAARVVDTILSRIGG